MRYTYVQGPRNSPFNAYSGIARRFALALSNGSAPVCYEDGRQLRDFVNVADVTSANLIALDHLDATGVYNVGGGRATTVLEFARLMSKEFPGTAEPAVTGQFRVGDTRHTVSDISRLGAHGWAPRYTVDDNVRHYLDWFREQPIDGEWLARADAEMTRSQVVRRTVR
jgi:dTDP-L-rhamnose 4-epimerase